jgi:hypothetical protein
MKKIPYSKIEKAVRKQCKDKRYHMSLVGGAAKAVESAVNQGIDSYLEACFCPEKGDSYQWEQGARLECQVSAKSLPVLLRRLLEMGDEGKLAEDAESLPSDILGTLTGGSSSGAPTSIRISSPL